MKFGTRQEKTFYKLSFLQLKNFDVTIATSNLLNRVPL